MTSRPLPWVSLLLILALVTSPLAGVVSAADPGDYDADAEISNNGNYWNGQTLLYEDSSLDGDTTVRLRAAEDDRLVKELDIVDDTVVTFGTDDMELGEFYLETEAGQTLASFTLSEQSITAEVPEDATVENRDDRATITATVESSRNRYDLAITEVTHDGNDASLSKDALSRLVEGTVEFEDVNNDGDDEPVLRSVSSEEEVTLNFHEFPEGDYSFTVSAADTAAEDTFSVTVEEYTEASGDFANQFQETYRGNVVEIPVHLEGTQEGTLHIGSKESGYEAEVDFETNEDGEVVLLFDTAAAGQGAASDPTVTVKDEEGDALVVSESELREGTRLEAAQYLLELRVNEEEADLAAMSIHPVELHGASSSVVPGDAATTSIEDLEDAATDRKEVSVEDYALVQFEVDGLDKYFTSQESADDFRRDSKSANQNYAYISLIEQAPERNHAPNRLDVGRTLIFNDREDGGIYMLVDPQAYGDIEPGVTYEAHLNLMEENPYIEEDTILATEIEFTEATIELETNSEGQVELANLEGQTVAGETSLAPGREIDILARSEGDYPFRTSQTATVSEDGTFDTAMNMGGFEAPLGYEYEVLLPDLDKEYPGVIVHREPDRDDEEEFVVDDLEAQFSASAAEVEVGEEITFDASESTPAEHIEEYRWEFDDGGFDTGVQATHTYQDAGTYFVRLTVTTANGEQVTATELVTVTGESSESEEPDESEQEGGTHTLQVSAVDGEGAPVDANVIVDGNAETGASTTFNLEDGEYTVIVSAEGYGEEQETVTIDGDDEEVMVTLSDDDEPAPGQPGFGTAVALLALVAAALIAGRQQ